MLKKSKVTQSVLDKIQSLKNKSVFSIYKEYVLFIENSKLRLKEIQSYFVANCIPVCQNKWDLNIPKHIFFFRFFANILNFLKKKSLNLSKTSIQTLSTNLQCTNKCNKVSFSLQKWQDPFNDKPIRCSLSSVLERDRW
jgi:hypothetical protein